MSTLEERMAPEGKVWVCMACGKTAQDQYGIVGEHTRGWDVSCAVNSTLFDKDMLEYGLGSKNDRVVAINRRGPDGT